MAKREKEDEEGKKEPSLTKDILSDIRDKLTQSGGTGFYLRVAKKLRAGGGYSFVGRLDGNCADVEEELLTKWKDGHYNLYAHYNDNRRVPGVPAMSYTVGNPETEEGVKAPQATSVSAQSLKEQIEEARLRAELVRQQKQLSKIEEGEDEDEMGANSQVMQYVASLQAQIEKMQDEKKEDKVVGAIEKLAARLDSRDATPKRNDEVEALRKEIADLRSKKEKDELVNVINKLEAKIDKAASAPQADTGTAGVIKALSPFVPAFVAWIEKKGSKTEMLDIVSKITDAMKTKETFTMKDMITTLTPLAPTLMGAFKGPDMGAMLGFMGNMVTPMIEAMAQAASNPPDANDIGSHIKGLLGMVQKGLTDAKEMQEKHLQTEKVRARAAVRIAEVRGSVPPRQIAQPGHGGQQQQRPQQQRPAVQQPAQAQQQQAPAKQQTQSQAATAHQASKGKGPKDGKTTGVASLPAVRFANKIARAVEEQDEEFSFYVNLAEKELPADHFANLRTFKTGDALASYLSSLPGVAPGIFSSAYALKWAAGFVKAFHAGDVPQQPTLPTTDKAPPIVAAPLTPEEAAAVGVPAADEFPPIPANDYKYPKDSKTRVVDMEFGDEDMSMTLEYPSPETIAQREADRAALAAQVQKDGVAKPAEKTYSVAEASLKMQKDAEAAYGKAGAA